MIGFSDDLSTIKNELTDRWPSKGTCISLMGMAGIGKTTLAKEIFNDPIISKRFDCRAWVTVGLKYRLNTIVHSILAQVNPEVEKILKSLMGKRYIIALDDVWYGTIFYELKKLLPEEKESRILLTTRVEEAAPLGSIHQMRFMNKDESWYLLREKVFGREKYYPQQLEKSGKKIAENCEGLPLLIVTVAQLLSESEMSAENWDKAAMKQSSVFLDAFEKISRILLPSYEYLPENLKAFFLYMGAFPKNHKIPFSKLVKLWSAEGILAPYSHENPEEVAIECLKKLVSRSLVMVLKTRMHGETKTCGLHSVFWHFCKRVGGESNFFHILNSYTDGFVNGIKGQRRLCVHNNVLFSIKDVYDSIASISTARSLLCFGPPHQYPVPICSDLRLLRVLDALTIRFYEFPVNVLKLVLLRYLALTFNGNLPRSISTLWSLQFIWNMNELKHLQVTGSDLPDPRNGASLPKLLTLLDVSPHSCTKSVLEGLPNLKKLGIRNESSPDGDDEPLSCFDHISNLHQLESLKCVAVNPVSRSRVLAPPPASSSFFPESIKKLSLNGFGYPWEDIRVIASLPNLEVLKLRSYAFLGPEWESWEGEFLGLEFLLIEDSDLVHWRADDGCFPILKRLVVKHCYKLKAIPLHIGSIENLSTIEIVDCNPSVEASAKQLQRDQSENNYNFFDVDVRSSWEDGNFKS
ncbi:putative late blight resistance protein homolog r1b-17 [Phtheirospermum japonicum]|uniref:Putative late blight resistance protein homolog r1b-17 n=1 Tax=Phtheirospermum japonicum TaxID=374723 RepID=A0A830CSC7_9LAMI|nr:putative late blight resistance protein homolog r1b-17 [Phtheirospermum japonicum]